MIDKIYDYFDSTIEIEKKIDCSRINFSKQLSCVDK